MTSQNKQRRNAGILRCAQNDKQIQGSFDYAAHKVSSFAQDDGSD